LKFTAKDAKSAKNTQRTLYGKAVYFINIVPALFILPLFFVLLLVLFISFFVALTRIVPNNNGVGYTIIALQGDKQVHLHSDSEKAIAEANDTFKQYRELTRQTIRKLKQTGSPLPDVIIFPETVCPIPVLAFTGTVKPTEVYLPEEQRYMTEEQATEGERQYRGFVQQIETPVIFGLSTFVFKDNPDKPRRLNSALLVAPTPPTQSAALLYRYDKMHLVMFGEYIPFAEYLPEDFILRSLCPEANRGHKPIAMPIGQGRDGKTFEASVNICFESSVSHLLRNQVLTLRRAGHNPQVLVNMSNCGWFWYSHQIEQHLATHVFRAVENRMYYITATNGGYSAIIDPAGNIVSIGKRGEVEAVLGTIWVGENSPLTIYQRFGDGYALAFAIGVLVLTAINIRAAIIRLRESKQSRNL
jgi:apolipoprotein N-acyltransferase